MRSVLGIGGKFRLQTGRVACACLAPSAFSAKFVLAAEARLPVSMFIHRGLIVSVVHHSSNVSSLGHAHHSQPSRAQRRVNAAWKVRKLAPRPDLIPSVLALLMDGIPKAGMMLGGAPCEAREVPS